MIESIDWSRCELPMWRGFNLRAVLVIEGIHINGKDHRGPSLIASKVIGFSHPNEGEWIAAYPGTFTQLDDLKAICAKVDAFIEREMKRIEEESKPPWRSCTEAEARANPHLSQFAPLGHSWQPMSLCPSNTPLMYQTRAPKLEPKMPSVKAPDGWSWMRRDSAIRYGGGYGDLWLAKDDDPGGCPVPKDKNLRDAMLACVAAYDQQHDIVWFQHPANDGRMYQLVEVSK